MKVPYRFTELSIIYFTLRCRQWVDNVALFIPLEGEETHYMRKPE